MVTLVISGTLASCHRHTKDADEQAQSEVPADFDQYLNPVFTDAYAFADYAIDESKYAVFTKTISVLDRTTIITIATTVMKNNNGSVSWKTWLNEYNSHKVIYDNMDAVTKRQRSEDVIIDDASQSSSDTLKELNKSKPEN